MISFKAIVCLLETPITEEVQIKGLEVLKKLDKNLLLMHTRYFKVLESIITSLKEDFLHTIIDIISCSILEMLKMKQGYFLLRKIFKNAKQGSLQEKIVSLITNQNFIEFMSHNNGCLLSQCIVRNFMVDKCKPVMKNSQSFNKQIIKKAYNIAGFSENSDSKANCVGTIEDKDYTSLSRFFDNFILRLFPKYLSFNFSKSVSKSHKKILEAFFEVDNKFFRLRFSQVLLLSEGNLRNSIIRQILNLSNGNLEYFYSLLLKKSDCPKIFRKLSGCLETVSLKGLAKEIVKEWNSFLLNYKNNFDGPELDLHLSQLNINSQEPSNRAFIKETDPNFKNKLFVRIEDLMSSSISDYGQEPENQFDDFVCTNQTFFDDSEAAKYTQFEDPQAQLKKYHGSKKSKSHSNVLNKQRKINNTMISVDPLSQQDHTIHKTNKIIQPNNPYFPNNNQIIINQMQYMSYDFKLPTYSNSISHKYYPMYSNNGLLLNQSYVTPVPQSHSASFYIGKSQNGRSPYELNYIPKKYN